MPGSGASIRTKRLTRSGCCAAKAIADHVADIVRDEIGPVDLQRVEHARHVAGLRLLVEAAGRLGGEAHAAQVRHDDGVVARKIGGHRRPHVARLAIAVQQHDGRALPAEAHMDRGAVGCDLRRCGIPAESRRHSCSNLQFRSPSFRRQTIRVFPRSATFKCPSRLQPTWVRRTRNRQRARQPITFASMRLPVSTLCHAPLLNRHRNGITYVPTWSSQRSSSGRSAGGSPS